MKKALALVLAMLMALSLLAGCGKSASSSTAASAVSSEAAAEPVSITLWTYPIGAWKDAATVDGFVAEFNKVYPDITVKVEYLDYICINKALCNEFRVKRFINSFTPNLCKPQFERLCLWRRNYLYQT